MPSTGKGVEVEPGHRMVVTGSVLLLLAVIVGVLGAGFVIRQFDVGRFERDVAIEGRSTVDVPGEITFDVVKSIRDSEPDVMSVGIASSGTGIMPVCLLTESSGQTVELRTARGNEVFLKDPNANVEILSTARLGSGTYTAACQPGGRTNRQFTVGRVLAEDDVRGMAGPVLWFLGLVLVAGGLFFGGGITLVVGMVRRSRHRRESAGLPPAG